MSSHNVSRPEPDPMGTVGFGRKPRVGQLGVSGEWSADLDLRMSVKHWKVRRVIVCGGRDFRNPQAVWRTLAALPVGVVVCHGAARGADDYADRFARQLGMEVERFPADWTRGKRAGPERNEQMACSGADLCIAFPGGKGTGDMVRRAETHGIPVRKMGW